MRSDVIIPVTAAIVIERGELVLITQRREGGANALKWEFPGGKLETDESPEECLSREIREELCIEIDVGEIFHAVNFQYPHGSVLLMAYLCNWKGGSLSLREHRDYKWVYWEEILSHELADADRVIARKLVEKWRKRPQWIMWGLKPDDCQRG